MNCYRKNKASNFLKQPSHALSKDIKYEHIHVCSLTNVYSSLVKPQEGKVLVLQLLRGPHWRAGVTVRAPRDGVRRQQEVEQRKQETLSDHHYIQMSWSWAALYGDWCCIIKTSTDDEKSNVVESWAVGGQRWIYCCCTRFLILIHTHHGVPWMMLTGGSGR